MRLLARHFEGLAVKLVWVAADKIGSRLIRWGLDSDCSHFAVVFDERDDVTFGIPRGVVFHSYGLLEHVQESA